ncbi:hypothetical protein K443DRAFT_3598 [Laccaria amethystina LaAM-08-1]|uniref:Uncharacterized protein n=1 Tax=Laccaria amethystina LaAM-08-1 TaxID=1095629 RepID=A0A0C9XL97_9AGAR|nr:hypothetical protein K443DRAFT_3598 [Laccaria amethystina LaAM-08-1]
MSASHASFQPTTNGNSTPQHLWLLPPSLSMALRLLLANANCCSTASSGTEANDAQLDRFSVIEDESRWSRRMGRGSRRRSVSTSRQRGQGSHKSSSGKDERGSKLEVALQSTSSTFAVQIVLFLGKAPRPTPSEE